MTRSVPRSKKNVANAKDSEGNDLATKRGASVLSKSEVAAVAAAEGRVAELKAAGATKDPDSNVGAAFLAGGMAGGLVGAVGGAVGAAAFGGEGHRAEELADAERALAGTRSRVQGTADERATKERADLPAILERQAVGINALMANANATAQAAQGVKNDDKRAGILSMANFLRDRALSQNTAAQERAARAGIVGMETDKFGTRGQQDWRSTLEVKVNLEKGDAELIQDGRFVGPEGLQLPG